ncbi:MAG: methyltransferase domain-containing protein [Deltaproteobacteria bacterium]|nr:methyltransferase domain-containing protein [Deltaproteobacteria bacterium]
MDNQSYYDEFAAGYERERHHGYHKLIDALELGFIRRHAAGGRILEAGCGTGLLLREVAHFARQAVGFDLSRGMLGPAHARGLGIVQAAVTQVPFADASFDAVYSVKVLAHVEPIREALAELARVTRPGGTLVLEFYNTRSLRTLIKRLKPATKISARTSDDAVYTRYDSIADVRGYLPPGCQIVDVRGVRVLTPVAAVHRVPGLSRVMRAAEAFAADAPGLRGLGGFLLVAARKL